MSCSVYPSALFCLPASQGGGIFFSGTLRELDLCLLKLQGHSKLVFDINLENSEKLVW